MIEKVFKQVSRDVNKMLVREAKRNDWMWFYNLHIKEVVESTRSLLDMYGGDSHVVTLAAWMHDVSLLAVANKDKINEAHEIHHLESRDMTRYFLKPYKIDEADLIHICDCVLKHRNREDHKPESLEEKIVSVADSLSHFNSFYYFTYFKFHPEHDFVTMLKARQKQIDKDWERLEMLPRSKKAVKDKYLFFKELCENYLQ